MKYWGVALVLAVALAIGVRQCASDMPHAPGLSPELSQAINHARSTLARFHARLEKPKPTDRGFFLRVGIADPGKRKEILWLKGVHLDQDGFGGVVAEAPFSLSSVQIGSIVTVKDSDVIDWTIVHADGSREGNFTAGLEPNH